MTDDNCYERYPWRIVFLSNFVSLTIYVIGAYILYLTGVAWLVCYLLFLAFLEIRLMKGSCIYCYYYNKICAFGKGKLSSLFFKRGEDGKFNQKQISWKDLLPDMLVSMIPLSIGIILLITDFNYLLLALIITLVAFTTMGNGFIRGTLACCHCKQREIGCPAERLFYKNKDR